MSIPSAIDRPLLPDEFSIYFASQGPIPLARLATFLRKLDTVSAEFLQGTDLYLELSEYMSGSGEPRFRVVQRERASVREAAELQRRSTEAAERQASAAEKQLWWAKAGFVGSVLVAPLAAAIASSIVSGTLNPSTKSVVGDSAVTQIIVRAPNDTVCEFISADRVLNATPQKKSPNLSALAESELFRFRDALSDGSIVRIAGKAQIRQHQLMFRTLSGNQLEMMNSELAGSLAASREPVVIEATVLQNGTNWLIHLERVITSIDEI